MSDSFVTRIEPEKEEPYTVIFTTDDLGKYRHIEDECRKMIGHAKPTVDAVKVVRCVECKYRYVDGDNVRFNLCLLNHNKVQSDDWYCADGRREDAWEPNETDLKAMLDAGHETFVRVFSQDAKMNKEVESDG